MASTAPHYELIVVGGPNDGASVPINGSLTMGSGEYNSVRLVDPGVQPSHAKLDLTGDGSLWVTDLSGGSTLVDDAPVSQVELPSGSRLRVGTTEFMVHKSTSGIGVRASNVNVRNPANDATLLRPSGAMPSATFDKPDDSTLRPSDSMVRRRLAIQNDERSMRATVLDEEPVVDPTVMRSMMMPQQIIANRYRILDKLAAGGMGEVYKAEHTELGKVFALKVMKQELSQDPEFVERFKREAVASSRIGQHNIVDISDFGRTDDGRFYFVMEYLDGRTLADLINAEHALTIDRAITITLQIARALSAAHQQGIVHRDLKPENVVLIRRDGQTDFVKVLDFGVAKEIDGRGQGGGRTAVGMVVGTPQYMSPEQAAALPVDARSDIYSLGLILHELLSGAPVFTGETPSLLMIAHVTAPPRRVTSGLGFVLPEEIENLVMSMLAKKAEGRPQSMLQVITTLEEHVGQPPVRPSAKTVPMGSTPARGLSRAKAGPTDMLPARPSRPNTRTEPRQEAPEPELSGETAAEQSGDQVELQAPRSYAPLLAILGVLVVAAAGAVWFAFFRTVTPTTEAAAVAAVVEPEKATAPTVVVVEAAPPPRGVENAKPAMVTLTLTSKPPGAEVFQAEKSLGVTPLPLETTKSQALTLTFRLVGYVDEVRQLKPEADLKVPVQLQPKKKTTVAPVRRPVKNDDDLKDNPFR